MFCRLTMSMMQNECVNGTNMPAYELSNYSGDEDMTALLDALKQQMGCEFTIFRGDKRAYTTIQQNGQRVVGTRLSSELAEIVLKQGKSYVGRAAILGEDHLCACVPTYDASGQIDGLIFAGISMGSATQQISLTVVLSCLAGIVLIILGIIIIGAYIKGTVRVVAERVRQTAWNALQAKTQVGDMGNQLTDGNERMQEMISAMGEITESSNEIEKIIKTIEDIAFQTNILALNAAVETAHSVLQPRL